jgi:hypothetical protein
MAKHSKDWYFSAATGNEIYGTENGCYEDVRRKLGKWLPTHWLFHEFLDRIEPEQFPQEGKEDESFAAVQYGLEKAGY